MSPSPPMHSADGREIEVPDSQVEAYKNVGWYTPVTMYAPDGSTTYALVSQVWQYTSNGWYTEPVMYVYSLDGRVITIYKSELQSYLNVGWYQSEPNVTIYHPNGSSKQVPATQVQQHSASGWYTYPVITVYKTDGSSLVIEKSRLSEYQRSGWMLEEDIPKWDAETYQEFSLLLLDALDYGSDCVEYYSTAGKYKYNGYTSSASSYFSSAQRYAKYARDELYECLEYLEDMPPLNITSYDRSYFIAEADLDDYSFIYDFSTMYDLLDELYDYYNAIYSMSYSTFSSRGYITILYDALDISGRSLFATYIMLNRF